VCWRGYQSERNKSREKAISGRSEGKLCDNEVLRKSRVLVAAQ
jgi:hypothetical protein